MIAGLVLGGLSSLAKIGVGIHQNKLANKIKPVYTPYATSEHAKTRLGMANNLFNGRMEGANAMGRNIQTGGANARAGVSRNATDGAQALALNSGIYGQEVDAFGDLQTKEAQNKYDLLGNLNQSLDAMTQEGDKVYNDKLMKFQMDSQQKAALRSSGLSNIFGGVNDAASMATQYGQQKQQGQFNQQYLSMLGGGGGANSGVGGMSGGLSMAGYNSFNKRGF